MRVANYIKNIKDKFIIGIKILKDDPLNGIGHLVPILMLCTTIMAVIVALIKYVTDGILQNQLNIISSEGFGGVTKAFTSGTSEVLSSGITSTILWLLIILDVVVMLILFYKNENHGRKLFLSISMGIFGGIIVLVLIIMLMDIGIIPVPESVVDAIGKLYWSTAINGTPMAAVIGGILLLASLVMSILLILRSESAWIIKECACFAVISFIVAPLGITIIENIIPLVVGLVGGIITIFVIVVVGYVGIKIVFSESGSSGYSQMSASSSASSALKKASNQREIKNWNSPFWRDKGGLGLGQPQADCIYTYNAYKEKQWICTVSEYEKGEIAIIDAKTKCRVMEIAGCKRPIK